MLNKELLLLSSLTEKDLEYTHIIIVGQGSDYIGFAVESDVPAYGSIAPNTFKNVEIWAVTSSGNTGITFNKLPSEATVYIGRTDTKKIVALDYVGFGFPVFQNTNNDSLFTSIDVGKEIKLWIANTPPPLGLENFLRRFLKEALYVK